MRRTLLHCLLLLTLGAKSAYPQSDTPVFSLIQQFDRLAAQQLWPGFRQKKHHLKFSMAKTHTC